MNAPVKHPLTTAEIIGMDRSPTSAAVAEAIIGDIKGLAFKHVAEGDWPTEAQKAAAERLIVKVARTMLAEALNSEAMNVVDAVVACDAAERASVWGADTDYETPTADLLSSAEGFSDYTCSAVQQQMEAAQ